MYTGGGYNTGIRCDYIQNELVFFLLEDAIGKKPQVLLSNLKFETFTVRKIIECYDGFDKFIGPLENITYFYRKTQPIFICL